MKAAGVTAAVAFPPLRLLSGALFTQLGTPYGWRACGCARQEAVPVAAGLRGRPCPRLRSPSARPYPQLSLRLRGGACGYARRVGDRAWGCTCQIGGRARAHMFMRPLAFVSLRQSTCASP